MTKWHKRLAELGIELPEVAKPVAAYVPAVKAGRQIFTSGQLPMRNGELMSVGHVGVSVTIEEAAVCARQCALNALAAINSVVDLNKIDQIVKVTGYISSGPDFTQQSAIMNGASDLLLEIFGDSGKHARTSISVASLPFSAPVEVELVVRISD
ncbi:MAG: RidA family protein [Actinobacteria bacterium]|nr:RidA family protein [Actinomycetota bacterium]